MEIPVYFRRLFIIFETEPELFLTNHNNIPNNR